MAGKYLRRGAIIDTIKGEHRINAIRKREGLMKHPVRTTSCGCPDPNCGAFHVIRTDCTIPSSEECSMILSSHNKAKKNRKRRNA